MSPDSSSKALRLVVKRTHHRWGSTLRGVFLPTPSKATAAPEVCRKGKADCTPCYVPFSAQAIQTLLWRQKPCCKCGQETACSALCCRERERDESDVMAWGAPLDFINPVWVSVLLFTLRLDSTGEGQRWKSSQILSPVMAPWQGTREAWKWTCSQYTWGQLQAPSDWI